MSIVSSSILSDQPQKDGRRWIVAQFIDQIGQAYTQTYLAPNAGFDAVARLAADASAMGPQLTASEVAANIAAVSTIGSLASPTFVYSTVPVNVAALRAAYQVATQVQAIMMGDFLASLTNGQLQTAFGLTAGQVTTLRTNFLTPAANAAATIRAAVGS